MGADQPLAPLRVGDKAEDARLEETRRRRRMIDGTWDMDLDLYLRSVLHASRVTNLGKQSRGINLFRSVCDQLSTHYDEEPTVRNESSESEEQMHELLRSVGWYGMARRHSQYVMGLRESLYRVTVSPETGRIILRIVPPDEVRIETAPGDPREMRVVRHAQVRSVGGKDAYCWDVWDLKTGEMRIETMDGEDVTSQFIPEEARRPYVDDEGAIPTWVLYHAEDTGKLWDPHAWCELVDAAFDAAVGWNGFHQILRDASWAQRGTIDLELPGVTIQAGGEASSIPTAPTSLLNFRSIGDRGGSTFQYQVPVKPMEFADSVLAFQKSAQSTVGIHPDDIQRTSGDSGYAIQLRRSAQRRFAMASEPQFRQGDTALFRILARLSNAYVEGAPPIEVDGWSITYNYLDDPVEDRLRELDYGVKMVEAGMWAPSTLYMATNPGVTRDQARTAIIEAAYERRVIQEAVEAAIVPAEEGERIRASRERAAALLAGNVDNYPEEVRGLLMELAANEMEASDE